MSPRGPNPHSLFNGSPIDWLRLDRWSLTILLTDGGGGGRLSQLQVVAAPCCLVCQSGPVSRASAAVSLAPSQTTGNRSSERHEEHGIGISDVNEHAVLSDRRVASTAAEAGSQCVPSNGGTGVAWSCRNCGAPPPPSGRASGCGRGDTPTRLGFWAAQWNSTYMPVQSNAMHTHPQLRHAIYTTQFTKITQNTAATGSMV